MESSIGYTIAIWIDLTFWCQNAVGCMYVVGYRDAQVGWVEVTEDVAAAATQRRHALFLVIYAPRRGLLEVLYLSWFWLLLDVNWLHIASQKNEAIHLLSKFHESWLVFWMFSLLASQVKSSQVAFNKNKWQSHEFYKHVKNKIMKKLIYNKIISNIKCYTLSLSMHCTSVQLGTLCGYFFSQRMLNSTWTGSVEVDECCLQVWSAEHISCSVSGLADFCQTG